LYLPSEDSIFLSNTVNHYHGNLALEIGTSSGIILKELSKNFRIVIGTDIDFDSLKHLQSVLKNSRLICCDAATASVHILASVLEKLSEKGKILIMVSSLSKKKKLESFISDNNLIMKQIAQKGLFYESLEIIEIMR